MTYRAPKWFLPSMILGLVSYDVYAKTTAFNDSPSLATCFNWFGSKTSDADTSCVDFINYHYDKVIDAKLAGKVDRLAYRFEGGGLSSFEERALKTRVGSAVDRTSN
ncbi:hypothetical protein R50073_41390 [Maricurvus nonylphenolicus]|uniref:hypothetical protein n=1 Tax=Maricurvus nonylphenolicus TaxID=1008307 RepID=UPI0036F20C04